MLAYYSDDPVAPTYSCHARYALGQRSEAHRRVVHALEIDPKNVLAIKQLAEYRIHQALLNGEDGRDTVALLQGGLRLAPHAPELQALMAHVRHL